MPAKPKAKATPKKAPAQAPKEMRAKLVRFYKELDNHVEEIVSGYELDADTHKLLDALWQNMKRLAVSKKPMTVEEIKAALAPLVEELDQIIDDLEGSFGIDDTDPDLYEQLCELYKEMNTLVKKG